LSIFSELTGSERRPLPPLPLNGPILMEVVPHDPSPCIDSVSSTPDIAISGSCSESVIPINRARATSRSQWHSVTLASDLPAWKQTLVLMAVPSSQLWFSASNLCISSKVVLAALILLLPVIPVDPGVLHVQFLPRGSDYSKESLRCRFRVRFDGLHTHSPATVQVSECAFQIKTSLMC
jgi:hypothetical protein